MRKLLKLCASFLVFTICGSLTAISISAEGFTDISENDYFFEAVNWGIENGITYGVSEDSFAPEGEVTRAQAVTFLWRMSGEPSPSASETFSDVEAGSWYETAVAWAVENNITSGTGDGMFSPDAICNRAMCITFLYRMIGAPMDNIDLSTPIELNENSTMEDFGNSIVIEMVQSMRKSDMLADVPNGSYFELPVFWGLLNGIITEANSGISEEMTLFRSEAPCLRGEMISFLYQTKLMQDAANAPVTFEMGPITLPIPQKYYNDELLFIEMYGVNEYEDEDEEYEDTDEDVVIVSERASKEAAEAMSEEDTEGIGELFRIVRVSENRLHELLCGDMSGIEAFAKDESGKYYLFCTPTDVRYVRKTNEQMNEDIEQWTELNSWARGELKNEILSISEGISGVYFTNTMLDMYLARIAYAKDVKYTISTTEFGPLEPGNVDPTEYAEFLLSGTFAPMDFIDEEPDGEYVVLNFPEEGVRYDFFEANKNLVREVRGDYVTFYKRGLPDPVNNTEVMQKWYDALAKQAGKK